jgi:hypothetical protein
MRPNRTTRTLGLLTGVALAALALPASALAGGTTMHAELTGAKEVPSGSGAPEGTGSIELTLKPKRSEVCVTVLEFRNIGKATSSGIFKGDKTTDGPTKVVFFEERTSSPFDGCVAAKKKVLKRIKRKPRNFHVNVETKKYPAGAIRGQLEKGSLPG